MATTVAPLPTYPLIQQPPSMVVAQNIKDKEKRKRNKYIKRYELSQIPQYLPYTLNEQDQLCASGLFSSRPSDLFLAIYGDMLKTLERLNNPYAGIVAPELLACEGIVPVTITSKIFNCFKHYYDTIIRADTEILLSCGFWEIGRNVGVIRRALIELNRRASIRGKKVVVKVLWGRASLKYHKILHPKQTVALCLPSALETPFLSIEVSNAFKPLFGVFHTKFMIVDRKVLLLTSANINDKPNVEMVVHLEGKIVDSFYSTFNLLWGVEFTPQLPLLGTPAPPSSGFVYSQTDEVHTPCVFHSPHSAVPMVVAHRGPGYHAGSSDRDNLQNTAWLSIFYRAQKSIFIQTPDFNASLAVKGILHACMRGVKVTIYTCRFYNSNKERIPGQGGENIGVLKKMYKYLMYQGCAQNLTVGFFVSTDMVHPTKNDKCHIKFLSADGQIAMMGSGNMDTQTWFHSQEVNVVIDSALLVKEWTDLFEAFQKTTTSGLINPLLPISPIVQIDTMMQREY
eukprot:TRINITY_DN6593_c0_g1_i1.p1 TRINITY_DN6593_c0_g1~~TRINITY_DN6593_c0_g1_i1.p1  ORF type:complete len:511 (+),score=110.86 TRINITY_DN6593_c0_g1_i1:62-1594(+)